MCEVVRKSTAFVFLFVLALLCLVIPPALGQVNQPVYGALPPGVTFGNPGAGPDYRYTVGLPQQSYGFSQHDGAFYSPNVNVAQPCISGQRTWSAPQDMDINVNNYRGYHSGWEATTAALGAGSPPPIGSVTTAIPISLCSRVYMGGTGYYNCGGVYYLPSYQGSTVTYEVVRPPG